MEQFYLFNILTILILDTAKQLDTWQTRGVVDPNIEIPLLMQNQVPEGFETDEHLDVSLRPDGVCTF
jgi:G patch domain/KOW motif-containing protein